MHILSKIDWHAYEINTSIFACSSRRGVSLHSLRHKLYNCLKNAFLNAVNWALMWALQRGLRFEHLQITIAGTLYYSMHSRWSVGVTTEAENVLWAIRFSKQASKSEISETKFVLAIQSCLLMTELIELSHIRRENADTSRLSNGNILLDWRSIFGQLLARCIPYPSALSVLLYPRSILSHKLDACMTDTSWTNIELIWIDLQLCSHYKLFLAQIISLDCHH